MTDNTNGAPVSHSIGPIMFVLDNAEVKQTRLPLLANPIDSPLVLPPVGFSAEPKDLYLKLLLETSYIFHTPLKLDPVETSYI